VKSLNAQYPDLGILIYSMYDESVYAERAIQAGASGYVMKNEPVRTLVEGLRRVAAGEIFLSESMTSEIFQKLINQQPVEEEFGIDTLTDRELEVFHLLGEGYLLDEIKDKLHVSRSAVDKYRRQAMKKLGCDSVRDLLRYAIRWFHAQGSKRERPRPDDA
jgi:DNA-binding NarL/FixJ family response regulator